MNMFTNAPKAPSKAPAKGKPEAVTEKVDGIHLYAALKAVAANVAAQVAVVEADIKEKMAEHFIAEGMKLDRRPVNYTGTDNGSSASLQLKCLPSTSGISEASQKLLSAKKIPVGTAVTTPATFIVNPAYADLSDKRNADMLARVSKALETLGLPVDFFMQQDEVSKVIATEKSIDAVMALKSKDDVATLLPLVTCMAIKAKLAENADPFAVVEGVLGEPEADEDSEDTVAA